MCIEGENMKKEIIEDIIDELVINDKVEFIADGKEYKARRISYLIKVNHFEFEFFKDFREWLEEKNEIQ